MTDDVTIHALLARIDERTENTQHRLRNLEMKLEAQTASFVPRQEIERMHAAMNARVGSLEDDKTWLVRNLWGLWVSGAGVLVSGVAAYLKLAH